MSNFSLFAHNYNTVPGGVVPPPAPLESRSDAVMMAGRPWSGYHDGWGLIHSSPDGQNLVWNYKGTGQSTLSTDVTRAEILYSLNGGVTWARGNNLSGTSNTPHVINCIQYHAPTSRWYLLSYESPDRQGKIFTSDDGGATWTFRSSADLSVITNYCHGFRVNTAGNLYWFDQGGVSDDLASRHNTFPYATGSDIDLDVDAYGDGSGWHVYQISPTHILHLLGGEGTGETDGYITLNDLSGIPDNYKDAFTSHIYGATAGNGVAVFQKGAVGTVMQYQYITVGVPKPLPVFEIDFGVTCQPMGLAYSPALGGYVFAVYDTADPTMLYLKHNLGDDFTTFYDILPVRMNNVMNQRTHYQFYWAIGDVFYLAYNATITGDDTMLLERITLNSAASYLWSPLQISPYLWYDASHPFSPRSADTVNVEKWASLGVSKPNADAGTATRRPTIVAGGLDGKKVLRFDGVNDEFSVGSSNFSRNVSSTMIFHVVKSDVVANRDIIAAAINTGGNNRTQSATYSGGGRRLDSDGFQNIAGTRSPTAWAIVGILLDNANAIARMYTNGVLDGEDLTWQSAGLTSNTASVRFRIGASSNTLASNWFDGDMAEIIVKHNDVTSVTRELIEGYLAWKWGLEALLPISHPYKLAPP